MLSPSCMRLTSGHLSLRGAPTVSDLKMVDQCQAKIGPTSTYISRGAYSNHNTVQNTIVMYPTILVCSYTLFTVCLVKAVFKTPKS